MGVIFVSVLFAYMYGGPASTRSGMRASSEVTLVNLSPVQDGVRVVTVVNVQNRRTTSLKACSTNTHAYIKTAISSHISYIVFLIVIFCFSFLSLHPLICILYTWLVAAFNVTIVSVSIPLTIYAGFKAKQNKQKRCTRECVWGSKKRGDKAEKLHVLL